MWILSLLKPDSPPPMPVPSCECRQDDPTPNPAGVQTTPMQRHCLRFYIHENHRHDKKLAYEWLLEQSAELGVSNGSAFRAIAGFRADGHHHDDLMESLMDKTVIVELLMDADQVGLLLALLREARLPVVMTRSVVEFESFPG